MISQCEIRKLYARKAEPEMDQIIEFAKTLERRRCGHLPEDFPEPLSTNDCFKAVVDPKGNNVNKHKLVVVCQDDDVRRTLRAIPGVPQIYLKRSVMILEPMASQSAEYRAKEERSKYRAGLRGPVPGSGAKRKRDEDDDGQGEKGPEIATAADDSKDAASPEKKAKKKTYGPKGVNPLAVQKKKKADGATPARKHAASSPAKPTEEEPAKKKRKRKHKKPSAEGEAKADEPSGEGVALEA